MKNSRELLIEILDLADQAIAIREAITWDMPSEIFRPLNKASLDLLDLADNKIEDLEKANADATEFQKEQDRFISKTAIDRVFDMELKKIWRAK